MAVIPRDTHDYIYNAFRQALSDGNLSAALDLWALMAPGKKFTRIGPETLRLVRESDRLLSERRNGRRRTLRAVAREMGVRYSTLKTLRCRYRARAGLPPGG
jgi:hypothetical protein